MFTGIIEETGVIRAVRHGARSSQLTIAATLVVEGTQTGDSICTNGVCLTVIALEPGRFTVDVMPETMRLTNLSDLKTGSRVNLERALRLSDRLGGHMVSGHVDGTGLVKARRVEDNARWFTILPDRELLKYIPDKGSVAIDGISLTVAGTGPDHFRVSVIPHTRAVTNILERQPGDKVNIECDLVAKYLEQLIKPAGSGSRIDPEFLLRHGF